MHGNYRHAEPASEGLQGGREARQITGAHQGTFRKQANQFARAQTVLRRLVRPHPFQRRVRGRDRNRAHPLRQPVNGARLIKTPRHQEANGTAHARAQQEGIDERDVVAHQQRRAALRQVFPTANFNSIECVGQQPKAEAND